jgi:hypothetical protein
VECEADDGVCTVVALSCGPGFTRRRSELRSTTYKQGLGGMAPLIISDSKVV